MVQAPERPAETAATTAAPVLEPITMKSLLEAGVHFGHQTRRWNPRMRRYIFTQRNGIHIIDLQQTMGLIGDAYRAMVELAASGGKVLFVGTKKQAQDVIASEAERTGQWYVNQRWLGGTLTNFQTIKGRIDHMKRLQEQRETGYLARLPKKETVRLTHTLDKLEKYFTGLRNMDRLPAALFVIDIGKEDICIAEARRLNIPIFFCHRGHRLRPGSGHSRGARQRRRRPFHSPDHRSHGRRHRGRPGPAGSPAGGPVRVRRPRRRRDGRGEAPLHTAIPSPWKNWAR